MYPSTMSDYLVRSSMEERLRHAESVRRGQRPRWARTNPSTRRGRWL